MILATILDNWSIRKKLFSIGVLALVGILCIIGPITYVANEISSAVNDNEKRVKDIELFEELHIAMTRSSLLSMDTMINQYEGKVSEQGIQNFAEAIDDFRQQQDTMRSIALSDEEKAKAERFAELSANYLLLLDKQLSAMRKGEAAVVTSLDNSLDRQTKEMRQIMQTFRNNLNEKSKQSSAIMLKTIANSRSLMLLLVGVVTLTMFYLLAAIIRSIVEPLGRMTQGMHKLAERDLSVEIPGVGRMDELGQMADAIEQFKLKMIAADQEKEQENQYLTSVTDHLKQVIDAVASGDLTARATLEDGWDAKLLSLARNLNSMIGSLSAVTRQIYESSDSMSTSLAEVRSAMLAQSSASTEQASAINETTSTLSEIKATSNQTLEKAQSQSDKAEKARSDSQHGNLAVSNAILGMERIHQKMDDVAASILELSRKTQQVSEITEVVDDLARQSKMLALNASIEAAKAGDSGQGFAVVAEEIRNLAEQSRESTAQVKLILQDIRSSTEHTVMVAEEGTKQVTEGNRLIDDAGKVITALNIAVEEMAMESQQITAAVRQETAGIDQISLAMSEISTATNNAVASIRQTEIAVENLGELATNLKDQVRIYRV